TVAGAFTFHVAPRQAMELIVDNGSQFFERVLIPVAPGAQEQAHVDVLRWTGSLHLVHFRFRLQSITRCSGLLRCLCNYWPNATTSKPTSATYCRGSVARKPRAT